MDKRDFWPSNEDRVQRSARILMPMNNPEAVSPIVITESIPEVDRRLKHDYPLYRVARFLGISAVAKDNR